MFFTSDSLFFYLFAKCLTDVYHSFLKSNEYLYDYSFKFSIWHITYIHFAWFSCGFYVSLIWDIFLCPIILCTSLCLLMLAKSAISPALEYNGFMKKRYYSALQCNVFCSPGSGASGSVSYVCCICPAIVSQPIFPSVQSFAEVLFVCCELCSLTGWVGCFFNKMCPGLFVK